MKVDPFKYGVQYDRHSGGLDRCSLEPNEDNIGLNMNTDQPHIQWQGNSYNSDGLSIPMAINI